MSSHFRYVLLRAAAVLVLAKEAARYHVKNHREISCFASQARSTDDEEMHIVALLLGPRATLMLRARLPPIAALRPFPVAMNRRLIGVTSQLRRATDLRSGQGNR